MDCMAYIKGVLDGDAYISREVKHTPRIVLEVKSHVFAEKFKNALRSLGLSPHINERHRIRTFNGYTFKSDLFIVRARCNEKTILLIQNIPLKSYKRKISYLTGFFDAEGCFHIKQYHDRTCYQLKITNSDIPKLERVKKILEELGISTKLRSYNPYTPYINTQNKCHIYKLIRLMNPPFTRSLTGKQGLKV